MPGDCKSGSGKIVKVMILQDVRCVFVCCDVGTSQIMRTSELNISILHHGTRLFSSLHCMGFSSL